MTDSSEDESPLELFFGIAGPIGVDVAAISDSLANALRSVEYDARVVHLTKEMMDYRLDRPIDRPTTDDFYSEVDFKIKYANALCTEFKNSATLARIAIRSISNSRRAVSGAGNRLPPKRTAYVIRQLKRPDEVALLRRVYGRQFVLISAYGPHEQRQKLLEERLKRTLSTATQAHEIAYKALSLIEKDASEESEDYGQKLRETFHLGDVFIDGLQRSEMDAKLTRFVQALFGRTDIAPSKDEYGMYAAKSASLRSSDLSRQVGAAIFSDDGELITQGCNEVPKAFGGTYWDLEEPDHRDVRLGIETGYDQESRRIPHGRQVLRGWGEVR